MEIQTKYIGTVDITEEQLIQFPAGLPGFVEEKEFALLAFPGNDLFQLLQSIHNPDLAFVITDPYQYYQDYSFDLDKQIQDVLKIKEREDVVVMTIVTIHDPFVKSTLNLKAPLIFNKSERLGKQYILQNTKYLSQTPMISKEQEVEKRDA